MLRSGWEENAAEVRFGREGEEGREGREEWMRGGRQGGKGRYDLSALKCRMNAYLRSV